MHPNPYLAKNFMPFSRKFVFFWPLLIFLISIQADVLAQSRKKTEITDWIGPLIGVNEILFYPNDINGNPIKGGNPTLIPDMVYGLSYHHTFTKRWSHLFQFRIADHQMKYWKSTRQFWHYNDERVIVKSDTGQYHMKYKDATMNYMFGWTVNKKARWNVYTGLQMSFTIDNQSTKTVDRLENGYLDGFDYVPHPQTLYFYDETFKTFSPDAEIYTSIRTDCGIALSKQWMLRPVLEYGWSISGVYNHINRFAAVYLELYKAL